RRMAPPEARAGPLAGATRRRRTAHRGLASAGLARLLEHLGDEALAPVLRGTGADAEIVVAAVGHGYALCKLRRVWSCKARGHACSGAGLAPQAARRQNRSVPRNPHVQTGFRRGPVPRPFVLPSAFALRCRSGHRRPGGATARASSAPGNAATAAGRARSRQDTCTWEGNAKCSADALALHARRHADGLRIGTPDGTMRGTAACSESAAIIGVPPTKPDARRRSRRTR